MSGYKPRLIGRSGTERAGSGTIHILVIEEALWTLLLQLASPARTAARLT
jgi:hypothetical protein